MDLFWPHFGAKSLLKLAHGQILWKNVEIRPSKTSKSKVLPSVKHMFLKTQGVSEKSEHMSQNDFKWTPDGAERRSCDPDWSQCDLT